MFTCLLEYLDPIEDHGKGAGKHHKAVESYFILTRTVKSEYDKGGLESCEISCDN